MDAEEKQQILRELRERIRRSSQDGVSDTPPAAEVPALTGGPEPVTSPDGVESFLRGRRVATPFGEIFETAAEFSGAGLYGMMRLAEFLEIKPDEIAEVFRLKSLEGMDASAALFLDTETCFHPLGGPMAFLIGLGFFDGRIFRVRQIFCRSDSEERASLELLAEYLPRFGFLVTYNGRGFDLPLLRQRLRVHRMEDVLRDYRHVDLLPLCRGIWKGIHADCRLTTLESRVVGFERGDDVEGRLIPGLYDQYRQAGDLSIIRKVFDHNIYDVATMAALAARLHVVTCRCTLPDAELSAEEHLAVGRRRLLDGKIEAADLHFQKAAEHPPTRRLGIRELSMIKKRQGKFDEAAEYWRELMEIPGDTAVFDPLPYIELAKDLEHRRKDAAAARDIVLTALSNATLATSSLKRRLYNRRDRLTEKINK